MKVDIYKNYIARIEASVGSELFRHLYVVSDNGGQDDVAHDGMLSCAIHVSSILSLVGLIDRPHATVETTLRILKQNGWVKTDDPQQGAIIHWPASKDGYEHIGFWLSLGKVVSNSTIERIPIFHTETMIDGRRPITYYIYPDIISK